MKNEMRNPMNNPGNNTTYNTAKWDVKDVITTVLLSFLLIVIQLAVTMIAMVNHFVSMVLSIGITMFLCAPVYVLLMHRVRKHFVTLIYMTMVGIIYLLMGNWYLLPYFVAVGILCELILWRNTAERSGKSICLSWTLASLLYNGVNLLPIWFFWETYYAFAMSSGMERGYVDSYLGYYTSPGWIAFIVVFTTLMGFLGSLVGSRMMQKHFRKTGILE